MTTGPSIWCANAPILRVMDVIRRRRRAISTALALLLAVESVAAVSAAASSVLTPRSAAHALPAAAPAGEVLAATSAEDRIWEPASPVAAATGSDAPDYAHPRPAIVVAQAPVKAPAAAPSKTRATPSDKSAAKVTQPRTKAATTTSHPRTVSYVGRNHVWIPALGMNQSVSSFSCSRAAPPDNDVYRWGCAGSNNVYLLGHAYGVFKPLHDAYVSGRLKTGMKVYYADGSGRTHVYSVQWWRLTKPTTDASWAWAPQSVPSMTLQTCIGAQSQYRLMVRLVQVG